jgi:hypothetical protein
MLATERECVQTNRESALLTSDRGDTLVSMLQEAGRLERFDAAAVVNAMKP